MELNKLLAKAIRIAATGFENTMDKGGVPYFCHCAFVAGTDTPIEDQILGYLHDVPEDGVMTIVELAAEGFPADILADLYLLTRKDGQDWKDYIKGIAQSPRATRIKLRDLRHNSDITRLKGFRKKDMDRVENYQWAYHYLSTL